MSMPPATASATGTAATHATSVAGVTNVLVQDPETEAEATRKAACDTQCNPTESEMVVHGTVTAVQIVILYLCTVVLSTLSVRYVFLEQSGRHTEYHTLVLADTIRVFGSWCVDAMSLYFMIQGYLYCAEENRLHDFSEQNAGEMLKSEKRYLRHVEVIVSVLPDMLWAAIPFVVLSCVAQHYTPLAWVDSGVWVWVQHITTPVLLSTLVDFREENRFRSVNEHVWIAQLTIIYAVMSPLLYMYARNVADSLNNESSRKWLPYHGLAAWLLGFLHLYAVFRHPAVSLVLTRGIPTNLLFFVTGMLIGLVPRYMSLETCVASLLQPVQAMGCRAAVAAAVVLGAFYLYHAEFETGAMPSNCMVAFGGTPCLWHVDICNVRMLPLLVLFLLWITDERNLFSVSLFGPIQCSLSSTCKHVCEWVLRFRQYCISFVLISEIAAISLNALIVYLSPVLHAQAGMLFVLVEIVLVTLGCMLHRHYVSPSVQKFCTTFLEHPRVSAAIQWLLRPFC